jgi:hypothetical protein
MAHDNLTYGFSKNDATDLVSLLGNSDAEYSEMKPRGSIGTSGVVRVTVGTPVTGLGVGERAFNCTIKARPFGKPGKLLYEVGGVIPVYDPSECILDLADEELLGVQAWVSLFYADEPPSVDRKVQWQAINRCCTEFDY